MNSTASSCHHQEHCDGWVYGRPWVLARKSAEGQLSSSVWQTNGFVGPSGQGQARDGNKVGDVLV